MKEKLIFLLLISFQITLLNIVYWVIFKQDSTILILTVSFFSGLIGYVFGKRGEKK
jgi:hypothetical protein